MKKLILTNLVMILALNSSLAKSETKEIGHFRLNSTVMAQFTITAILEEMAEFTENLSNKAATDFKILKTKYATAVNENDKVQIIENANIGLYSPEKIKGNGHTFSSLEFSAVEEKTAHITGFEVKCEGKDSADFYTIEDSISPDASIHLDLNDICKIEAITTYGTTDIKHATERAKIQVIGELVKSEL